MDIENSEPVSRERVREQIDTRGQDIQDRRQVGSEEVEKSASIHTWQDGTVEQPFVSSGGIISRLFDSCIRLLRHILECSKNEGQSNRSFIQLRDGFLALSIWGEDHHLSEGYLDTRLHDCEELQQLVCTLLLSLAGLLVNGLLQRVVTNHAKRDDDILDLINEARKSACNVESPIDCTGDSVPDMTATLATLVDCIISLNPSLERLAKYGHNEQSSPNTFIGDRPRYLYHQELIESKFPKASQSLLERLGKCNWERFVRLKEQRETVQEDVNVQVEAFESKSRFYDSALGTSVPAQSELGGGASTYAATVVSSRAASSHQKLPKLPEKGRNGENFICEVCNRVVAIKRSQDWKKHIFRDLLAYTCIYDGCSKIILWGDCNAMMNHLTAEHSIGREWKSHVCPLCKELTGQGKEKISLHISRHMEAIALNVLPSGYESESESEINVTATDSASSPEAGSSFSEGGHTALDELSIPDTGRSDQPLSPIGPRASNRNQTSHSHLPSSPSEEQMQQSWHGMPYDSNPDQYRAHWYQEWLRDKTVERSDPWGFPDAEEGQHDRFIMRSYGSNGSPSAISAVIDDEAMPMQEMQHFTTAPPQQQPPQQQPFFVQGYSHAPHANIPPVSLMPVPSINDNPEFISAHPQQTAQHHYGAGVPTQAPLAPGTPAQANDHAQHISAPTSMSPMFEQHFRSSPEELNAEIEKYSSETDARDEEEDYMARAAKLAMDDQ